MKNGTPRWKGGLKCGGGGRNWGGMGGGGSIMGGGGGCKTPLPLSGRSMAGGGGAIWGCNILHLISQKIIFESGKRDPEWKTRSLGVRTMFWFRYN